MVELSVVNLPKASKGLDLDILVLDLSEVQVLEKLLDEVERSIIMHVSASLRSVGETTILQDRRDIITVEDHELLTLLINADDRIVRLELEFLFDLLKQKRILELGVAFIEELHVREDITIESQLRITNNLEFAIDTAVFLHELTERVLTHDESSLGIITDDMREEIVAKTVGISVLEKEVEFRVLDLDIEEGDHC